MHPTKSGSGTEDAAAADGRPAASGPAGEGTPNGTGPGATRASDAATERLASRVVEHLADGARHVRTLLSLGSERARLRLRRARWKLVRALLATLLGAALVVSGALYFARGLAATLAASFGARPWLGELTAGLLLLALVAGGLALVMALEERREIARLRRKYEHDGHGDDERGATARARAEDAGEDTGEDGGAAAGARAGARPGGAEPEPGRPRR